MKKIVSLLLVVCLLLSLTACGSSDDKKTTIKIGASPTPHAEILRIVKDEMQKNGYTLDIVEYNDYVLPNTGVENGDIDANFFQHQPYLDEFNAENNTHIVSILKLHYEPFGMYPGTKSSLSDIAAGDKIAVPNDGTNEGRALYLLAQEGIITMKEGTGFSATLADIESYNTEVEIIEMEAAQIPRALPDVAYGVINGNYAINAGLNVAKDAIAVEASDGLAAQTYGNVVCVKEGNENTEWAKALAEALKSDAVRDYINNTYEGAVVPLF